MNKTILYKVAALVLLALPAAAQQPLHTFGDNRYGRLGYGTDASTEVPTKVGSADWVAVAAGDFFSAGIQADGSLWTWGDQSEGQLGNGATIGSATGVEAPAQIGTDKDWVFITGGAGHTIAIKKDHTLWGWGDNDDNALGSSGGDLYVPTAIGGGTADWAYASGGAAHTLAIKTDGTLWAWGDNGFGKLGDGTKIDRSKPLQIGTDKDWVMVSAGEECSFGIKTDGSLWTWGQSTTGGTDNLTPVQLGTDKDWKLVSTAENSVFAIKTSGTLWAWGNNFVGQLGIGSSVSVTVPTQVGTDNNWMDVSGGYMHTVALKTDHTLWGMGAGKATGSSSALGINKPTQIGTSAGWYVITSGSGHVLALGSGGGTAIHEAQQNTGLRVYPNPATDVLTVSGNVASVTILNLSGQHLYQGAAGNIRVTAYAPGMYYYKAVLTDGTPVNGSFIKK